MKPHLEKAPAAPVAKMKRLWLRVFLLLLFAAAAFGCAAARSGIAPEKGFRDIAWGTPIDGVSGLTLLEKGGGNWKWGKRPAEQLRIGDVEVDAITYIFIDRLFAGVDVDYSGLAAFRRLIEEMEKALGPPPIVSKQLNMRTWKQGDTTIMLRYYRFQDAGTLKVMHGV